MAEPENKAEKMGREFGNWLKSAGSSIADGASALWDNTAKFAKTTADGVPKFWENNGWGGLIGIVLGGGLAVLFGNMAGGGVLGMLLSIGLAIPFMAGGAAFARNEITPWFNRVSGELMASGNAPAQEQAIAKAPPAVGQQVNFGQVLQDAGAMPKEKLAFRKASTTLGANNVTLANQQAVQNLPSNPNLPISRNL